MRAKLYALHRKRIMSTLNRFASALFCLSILPAAYAQGGSRGATSPFSAPNATIHNAPDRTYDLLNLELHFDVDYPNRLLKAKSINTLTALLDGTTQFRLNAGPSTKIEGVQLDGKAAHFTRDGEGILVDTAPSVAGRKYVVTVNYHLKKSEITARGGGWHWHEPDKKDASKVGFWTNGETDDTRDWAVTWDYPNDFTTTETHTTVPADWQVVGNGLQISDTPTDGGKRHTVVWRMTQAHATYLVSVVGGPFDIHRDKWRDVPLMFVCPKGMGDKLDYTFSHTKDILSFYSDKLGVKYPWPKYAQDMTYDFGGGQENVSATTYGIFLTDPREGRNNSDWLLAHETGHQWFGDYVTCKDWGQLWLNESFATFMEMSYTRFSRGANASMREIEGNSQGYFDESTRYKRPMATNFYSEPGVMFDQHTYPKGGVLLMSLRRQIGEQAFYAGLNRYLTRRHNGPVESNDLCEDMTDASGINLHSWFTQWIYKPGHPVIDWSWKWDDSKKEVVVHVNQTQDQSIGTPVYDVPTHVALLYTASNEPQRRPIHLNAASQDFHFSASSKPDAVAFDPDHDFLRQIAKQPWEASEYPAVFKLDPNPIDRAYALDKILDGKLTDADVQFIVDVLKHDQGVDPGIINTNRFAQLGRPELRSFWEGELSHADYGRRATAVQALGKLPKDPHTIQLLKALIDDIQPYGVVSSAINAAAPLDFAAVLEPLRHQASVSKNTQVLESALAALADGGAPEANFLIIKAVDVKNIYNVRIAGFQAMAHLKTPDARIVPILRDELKGEFIMAAAQAAGALKLKDLLPDLEAAKKANPSIAPQIDAEIAKIK